MVQKLVVKIILQHGKTVTYEYDQDQAMKLWHDKGTLGDLMRAADNN